MQWVIIGVKPVYYLKLGAVLKHVVSEILLSRNLWMGPVLCPIKNEEIYNIVSYQNFSMWFCIIFKKEISAYGSQVGNLCDYLSKN